MAEDEDDQPHDLSGLLGALKDAGEEARVTIGDIHHTIGERSFGPLLLIAGLIQITPVGAVPGVPTVLGVFILLTAGQVVIGREKVWIPQMIASRAVKKEKLSKAVDFLKPPARFIDRIIKPRLGVLLSRPAVLVIAAMCMIFAVAMPPLEFVPFGGAIPASAVAVFGLALTVRDGLLVIIGGVLGLTALAVLGWTLL